jgi:hypothetical protein
MKSLIKGYGREKMLGYTGLDVGIEVLTAVVNENVRFQGYSAV